MYLFTYLLIHSFVPYCFVPHCHVNSVTMGRYSAVMVTLNYTAWLAWNGIPTAVFPICYWVRVDHMQVWKRKAKIRPYLHAPRPA